MTKAYSSCKIAVSIISTAEASILTSVLITLPNSSYRALALLMTAMESSVRVCVKGFLLAADLTRELLAVLFAGDLFFLTALFFRAAGAFFVVAVLFLVGTVYLRMVLSGFGYAVFTRLLVSLCRVASPSTSRISATEPSPRTVAPVRPGTDL